MGRVCSPHSYGLRCISNSGRMVRLDALQSKYSSDVDCGSIYDGIHLPQYFNDNLFVLQTDLKPYEDPHRPQYKWMSDHSENLSGTKGINRQMHIQYPLFCTECSYWFYFQFICEFRRRLYAIFDGKTKNWSVATAQKVRISIAHGHHSEVDLFLEQMCRQAYTTKADDLFAWYTF